jgi:nicotinamide-nucleotide amidase
VHFKPYVEGLTMNAEILVIGTEILLGEIVDTNTQRIARALRNIGIDLFRTSTVGDNQGRVAGAVKDALGRADLVITSGGLGPTVDDVTRDGVAEALDRELLFQPDLWEQIRTLFARYGREPSENNRQQAHLPAGANSINNPIGTAPGFILECDLGTVVAMPGVPAELEAMLETTVLPYVSRRFKLKEVMRVRLVRTAGLGESWLDGKIQDLERLSNPTVGLSAHPGRVDVRLTAKSSGQHEADELLRSLEATLRQRLGDAVYGTDEDELEDVTAALMEKRAWRFCCAESGTKGILAASLEDKAGYLGGRILPAGTTPAVLEDVVVDMMNQVSAEVGLGLSLTRVEGDSNVYLRIQTPSRIKQHELGYGGPPSYAGAWAATQAINQLRLILLA